MRSHALQIREPSVTKFITDQVDDKKCRGRDRGMKVEPLTK
jgi:hypothetical protein